MKIEQYKFLSKFLTIACIGLLVALIIMIGNAKYATNNAKDCESDYWELVNNSKTQIQEFSDQYYEMKHQYDQCYNDNLNMLQDVTTKQYNTLSQQSIDDIIALLQKSRQPDEVKCFIPGMGQISFYCGSELKYACGGKFVDYKTYMNCNCPLQEPECEVQ